MTAGAQQQFSVVRPLFRGRGPGSLEDAFPNPVVWSSSPPGIISVDAQGNVTALAPGTAVLHVRSASGPMQGSTTVTVTSQALTSISVNPASLSLPRGRRQRFQAIGTFADASTLDLTGIASWSSSNPALAGVSNLFGSQGLVQGLNVGGPVSIQASAAGINGSASLTIDPPSAEAISIGPQLATINVGQQQQFSGTATLSDATLQPLGTANWSSSQPVTSIDNSGLATALSVGTTSITAQFMGVTSNAATLTQVLPLTKVSTASPFAPGCDLAGPGGTNYLNAEVEPLLVIDPLDARHLVGLYQQDRWRGGGSHGLITAVSRDGGATWSHSMAPFSRCEGGNASNGGDYLRSTDPWITFAPDGTLYASALSFSGVPTAVTVSRSSDGGSTWSDLATLITDTSSIVGNDKESITADPNDANYVYVVWDRVVYTDSSQETVAAGPTWFSRTTDGGAHWEAARPIYDPGAGFATIGNIIVVLPAGTLVDFMVTYDVHASSLQVIRSTDRGVNWSAPVTIDISQDIGVVDVKNGAAVRYGIATITVDPQSGALYVVAMDARFSGNQRDGIVFYKSSDGGVTWTPPVQINRAPNVQAFGPSVAVGTDGSIAVNYYDFRQDNSDPAVLLTNYWQITSHDGGATWKEVPLGGPFDLLTAPLTGLGYMVTDYEGLVASGDSFISLFIMANSGDLNNRTDLFASSTPLPSSTPTNGHIEVNPHPRSPMELHQEREQEEGPTLFHWF